MKKKILFVIDSLTIGGAEKSLVSLLNSIDSSKYEIDLLLFKKGGDLEKYVPTYIQILPMPDYFRFINNESISNKKKVRFLHFRIKTSIQLRINNFKKMPLHSEQVVFESIKIIVPSIQKKYDVAIAYSQGMPTYFVANKVTALKKVAWINTDYVNTQYNKEVDFESYKKIDTIISVSNHIKHSVSNYKKEYHDKVDIIKDIINPNLIYKMAEEQKINEFDKSFVNILTVGRLVSAKSFETAIEVARLLKNSGYHFKWFAIGEGPERSKLQDLIDGYQLSNSFILLGKRLNPYTYMKNCDIYVQTSIKEGFGLTVCEAKILKKPIVCTNFSTAKEIINNNVDGLIVEHDINKIFNGIKKYIEDEIFKNKIINELNSIVPYSSVDQLDKFYQLIEG